MSNQASNSEKIVICPQAFESCAAKLEEVSKSLGDEKGEFSTTGESLSCSWTCQSGSEFESVLGLFIHALENETSGLDQWCGALKSTEAVFEAEDQSLAEGMEG